MKDSWINPSELSLLWKQRGNQNYVLNSFISNGTFIQYITLQDIRNRRKYLGKIVASPKEGEIYHWPKLRHENLAPLIEMICINENISIFISPLIGRNLRIVVQDILFDPESFNKKRGYAEDILWALDYLNDRSLCLMNLTEEIIKICDISDKAVICDFSHALLIERVNKNSIEIPNLYLAPELKGDYFDPISAETWACGVMFLQIFTSYIMPSAFMGDGVQVLGAVNALNYDIVKEANPRAYIDFSITEDLRSFLNLFLIQNPKQRVSIKSAAVSPFLVCLGRSRYKDYESSQFSKCNKDVEYTSSFDKSKSLNFKFEYWRNWLPSKDIHLKKASNYRDKSKPSANKIVCTDFFSTGSNVSQYSKNYPRIGKKSSNERSDYDRGKVALKLTRSSNLIFEHNSEESVVDDKTSKMPQNIENGTYFNLRISISSASLNVERTSNFDEIQIANKKELYNNDIQDSNWEIKSSVNETDRTNKRFNSNSKSVMNFESDWLKPHANDNVLPVSTVLSPLCNENVNSVSHYNSLCDEIKELLKEKQSTVTTSKLKQSDQSPKHNDAVDCYSPVMINNMYHINKEFSKNNISTETLKPQIKYTDQSSKYDDNISNYLPESRHFNTTCNNNVNNIMCDYSSTETLVPCKKHLDQSSKNNAIDNEDLHLPVSTFFSTNYEENANNIYDCDYLNQEIKKLRKEKLPDKIKPQIAESKANNILKRCASNIDTEQTNQSLESQQDLSQDLKFHPQAHKDDNLKAGDCLTDKNAEVDESRINNASNTQEGIHHALSRRNSYKQAIMNDLPVVTEHETDICTEENNLELEKATFTNEISLRTKFPPSEEERETDIIGEDNGTILIHNPENSDSLEEIYLLNDTTILTQGFKKTKKRRRWLKYLCPGSK